MGFDYSDVHVTVGRLIEVVMDMLPKGPDGKHPTAWVEHLGPDNRTFIAAQIESATASDATPAAKSERKGKKAAATPPTVDSVMKDTQEARDQRRADCHHAVRKLQAWHSDGTPAVPGDIDAWVESLPQRAVDGLWSIAVNLSNFENRNFAPPKELAEK